VIRRALPLWIILISGLSEAALAQPFDPNALAATQAEAIDFILPRALEPVTARQLTLWGLSGLGTLDPALAVASENATITLLVHGHVALEATPASATPADWAHTAEQVVAAAYAVSAPLRRAGQIGVTRTLFEEMLARLDPYSRYVPPIDAIGDRDRRVGHASIGVALAQRGPSVIVKEVVMGSPAAAAGIMAGDVLQWVNDRTAINRDRRTIEEALNGPEGTTVSLVWRTGDGQAREATLTRMMVPPETVYWRRDGDAVIVQVIGFSQTTDQHISQVIFDESRAARPITGIILDLRGNRGGLLQSAVATAGMFLPGGVIVHTSGRAPEANRVWIANGREMASGARIVVLVDGGTASAAEIVAAALADRGRAVIIGSSTFGKGVVQTIDPLPDGGELFLTWSRILAPRGWPLQSLGVLPQICTSRGDERLRRQLVSLASGRQDMEAALRAHRAARAPLTPDQIVAIREPCPAADPRPSDLSVARSLLDDPSSYNTALLAPMDEGR
jgi:carboxyl-terminal processing protease